MRPPKEARSTASYVKHNHSSPSGHKSGNHEGRELQQLGVDASSYTEYDIYAYDPSVNRGPERIVVDNNNRVYYTNDHYRTFWRMMFVNWGDIYGISQQVFRRNETMRILWDFMRSVQVNGWLVCGNGLCFLFPWLFLVGEQMGLVEWLYAARFGLDWWRIY